MATSHVFIGLCHISTSRGLPFLLKGTSESDIMSGCPYVLSYGQTVRVCLQFVRLVEERWLELE